MKTLAYIALLGLASSSSGSGSRSVAEAAGRSSFLYLLVPPSFRRIFVIVLTLGAGLVVVTLGPLPSELLLLNFMHLVDPS